MQDSQPAQEPQAAGALSDERAPLVPFDPPTPLGCAGAAAYDGCFAFDHATPFKLTLGLPETTKKGSVVIVRFHRDGDSASTLVANQVEFRVQARAELNLYFQVFPGAYAIEAGVDLDGDGDAFGKSDATGWSAVSADRAVTQQASAALVDVADTPVSTAFALTLPQ